MKRVLKVFLLLALFALPVSRGYADVFLAEKQSENCEGALAADSPVASILNHLKSEGEFSTDDFRTLLEDLRQAQREGLSSLRGAQGIDLKRVLQIRTLLRLIENQGQGALAHTIDHLNRMVGEMQSGQENRHVIEDQNRFSHRRLLLHRVDPGEGIASYYGLWHGHSAPRYVPFRITREYWISDTLVTRAHWFVVMDIPYEAGTGDKPILNVSPRQILEFVRKLNQWKASSDPRLRQVVEHPVSDLQFSLPSIAQHRLLRIDRHKQGETFLFDEPGVSEISGDGFGSPRWPWRFHSPAVNPTVSPKISKHKFNGLMVVNVVSGAVTLQGLMSMDKVEFNHSPVGIRLAMTSRQSLLSRILEDLRYGGKKKP